MGEREASVLWMQTLSDFTGSPADVETRVQRVTVPVAYEAPRIALVLTNEYGSAPLRLARVSVSFGGSERDVLFDGGQRCAIESGERRVSDAIELPVRPSGRLVVTIEPDGEQHVAARGSAFDRTLVDGGESEPTGSHPEQLFYYGLSAVLAYGAKPSLSVCFFGDSLINQGYVSGEAARLLTAEHPGAVACNCGISGNRLLRAGSGGSSWAKSFGAPAIERFARDVTYSGELHPDAVFSLVGVNDLFQAEETADSTELPRACELIEGFRKLDEAADALGIALVMGTLPPFRGSVNRGAPAWSPEKEVIRQEVNGWLRGRPRTVDVDRIVRRSDDATRLAGPFDSGDHLHFSPGGGRAVGKEVFRAFQDILDR